MSEDCLHFQGLSSRRTSRSASFLLTLTVGRWGPQGLKRLAAVDLQYNGMLAVPAAFADLTALTSLRMRGSLGPDWWWPSALSM
jgi:hypothetical protein